MQAFERSFRGIFIPRRRAPRPLPAWSPWACASLRTTIALAFVAAALAIVLVNRATAQPYPSRPVTIVVPFAAGGNTDNIARLVAQRFGEKLGHQFVVEDRPGAAGAIAAEFVARSPADGYTLFMSALAQIAIVPAVNKTRYDPIKDFAPISVIGTNPFVLAVNKDMPVKTVAEFVAYVRAQPQKLPYATGGVGSQNHLSMALFLKRAGLEMIHVSYKGNAPAMSDLIAGHVPVMLSNLYDALPQAAAGAIRLIAVTGDQRASQIPDVPTISESGFPQFKTLTWNGLLAPAGTPKEVVDLLANQVAAAVKDAKFAERLASYGVDPLGNSPEDFTAMIAADTALWAEAVKIAGVKEQ
jgi:tripartite-type tricarboxylate transporter receptor subunit TctC